MSLKQQNQIQAAFSMASMTDVIFLLLVFFMATSTFVFPTAMEVDLPQGAEQTSVKPKTCVYVDSLGNVGAAYESNEIQIFDDFNALASYLQLSLEQDTTQKAVAIYADKKVEYGKIVDVLSVGARNGIKMVLATRASEAAPESAAEEVAP